jgi:diguanylate cyclase (GGDEF)-like protein
MVADVVRKIARRPRDMVARYGGEELAVILPDTDVAGAIRVAQDILAELRLRNMPHAFSSASSVVTLSAGVSELVRDMADPAIHLLRRADEALYHAKNAGRDRVGFFDHSSQQVALVAAAK